jgi:hypothetical protein
MGNSPLPSRQSEADPRLRPLIRLALDVSHAQIQMKPCEQATIRIRFHGMARTTIRRSVQIHDRFTNQIHEEVVGIPRRRSLKGFKQLLTR